MQRNIRWWAINWINCNRVVIEGSIKRFADRIRIDRVHRRICNHDNLHFRFNEPFIKRETNWDSEPQLRKLVSSLQSRSSHVKTLTYPYESADQYWMWAWLPIPETTFDCNERLWEKMNEALFESGKVNLL